METIHADERWALLKALMFAGHSAAGITEQQYDELKSVLADGTIRLLMRPKEKSFSVPVRVQVLAADELDATNVVESLLNGGLSGSDASDSVVGWLINKEQPEAEKLTGSAPIDRLPSTDRLRTMDAERDALKSQVRDLEARLDSLIGSLAAQAGMTHTLRSAVVTAGHKVEAVEAHVKDLKTEKAGLKARVGDLEEKVAQLQRITVLAHDEPDKP